MMDTMTQLQRKTNEYFFGVEDPAISDQLMYYGATVGCAIITALVAVVVW